LPHPLGDPLYLHSFPTRRSSDLAILASPIAPVFNTEYGLLHAMPEFQRPQVDNPLVSIEDRKNTQIRMNYRVVANGYAEVDFLEHFSFRTNLSADYGFNQSRLYQGLVNVYNPDMEGDDKTERIGNQLT